MASKASALRPVREGAVVRQDRESSLTGVGRRARAKLSALLRAEHERRALDELHSLAEMGRATGARC
jgi:hypothetical protein